MKIYELVRINYKTYEDISTGSRERHWPRLLCSFLIAWILAIFSGDASATYPIMVTAITILTGFTFTALFSNHVLADVGLPEASDESDRHDLRRLAILSQSFKARSSYFIALSIIDAVLLIAASLKFSTPKAVATTFYRVAEFIFAESLIRFFEVVEFITKSLNGIFFIFVTFIFIECLYTFFRLSETIIAIVDLRSNYMKAAEDSKKFLDRNSTERRKE